MHSRDDAKSLVQAMVGDGVAEILVGAIVDESFGPHILVGAGGIFADMTLRENMTLGSLSKYISVAGLHPRAERADVGEWLGRLEVQPPRPEARIAR